MLVKRKKSLRSHFRGTACGFQVSLGNIFQPELPGASYLGHLKGLVLLKKIKHFHDSHPFRKKKGVAENPINW